MQRGPQAIQGKKSGGKGSLKILKCIEAGGPLVGETYLSLTCGVVVVFLIAGDSLGENKALIPAFQISTLSA